MSSPPPGGPQPPPQQYPQQPYPQPPYPQQPYYTQPVAPPPKKSNTALIIVVIVVVVVVVVVAVAWYAITLMFRPVTNSQVRVTGISFTVNYLGGSTGYFDSSPLTTCTGCPITLRFPNYDFFYNLTLTNSGSVSHNVTDIAISGIYFNLISALPNPTASSPQVVNAGGSKTFMLEISATPLSGDHTLTGTITTN